MRRKEKAVKGYQALAAIVIMVAAMFLAIVHFEAPPHIPLIFGCMVAGGIAFYAGFCWEEILEAMLKGIMKTMEAVLIILLIGMLVATWIACGTVPTMIYYGLGIMSAKIFLPATFVICTLVAFAIGSWGTIGTIGLAFMGIGVALGMPAPLVAGCVISGSYLGEIVTPLSDATNLAAASTGTNVFDVVRQIIKIASVVFVPALVLYIIVGLRYAGAGGDVQATIAPLLSDIRGQFVIHPVAILPLVLMVICIIIKFPAIPAMLFGSVCGIVQALIMQHAVFGDLLNACYYGYECNSGNDTIDTLLSAGGLSDMFYAMGLAVFAMAYGGLMQHTGMTEALLRPLVTRIHSHGGITTLSTVTCILVNVVLPDQYLGIALPGQMYSPVYDQRKMNRVELGSNLLSGGAVTSPLIPWTTCGVYCMTLLGLSPLAYAPYAFYCLLLPVATIIWGFFSGRKEKSTVKQ